VDLGIVDVSNSNPVKPRIEWDRDNKKFIFRLNNGPPFEISYSVSDGGSPGQLFKEWKVIHQGANCTQTPRPVGSMDASFDDGFVNQAAAVAVAPDEELIFMPEAAEEK
jgi:hypothetical protein